MIVFKCVRYKNMLSTGNHFTEIALDKSPNTLVVGINGAGKSTMLDALTFALFGKTFRDINKPNLVNTHNRGDCVAEVELRIVNKDYKVVRGIKPNIFEIFCDGVMVNQDGAARDYQAYLEKNVLKFNYKAFTQIVILGTASFVPFMQLAAAERRTIIEDLLDIQIFTSMNIIVKDKIADIKNGASTLKQSIDGVLTQIEMQKKYVKEANRSNLEQIESKETERQQNVEAAATLEREADQIKTLIESLRSSISDADEVSKKLSKLHVYETQIEANKKKALKEEEFYKANNNCPTCKQAIEKMFKEQAIATANTKIDEFNKGITTLIAEQDKLNTRLTEINTVKNQIGDRYSDLTRKNASLSYILNYITKLSNEITELKGKKVLSEDMTKVSEELITRLRDLQLQRTEIVDSKQYYDVASTLLKDSGIKAKIVKQYLPVINKLVNKYLAAMDSFVNFEIDEEFNETIKSMYRNDFSYGNFSEGEKMRIDLALLFTWRSIAKLKNSMNTNLLILDEVFDSSLDGSGIEEIMKLLNSLGVDNNVFVISHKGDILADRFKSTLKFIKINNFSRIE